MKAICFGAAGGAKRLFNDVSKKYEIVAFTDNDPKKWGTKLFGIEVLPVQDALKKEFDIVVLTSAPGRDSILQQLLCEGVDEGKITTKFIDAPLEARIMFLRKLALMQKDVPSTVQVAEAGVFEGDFAKYINDFYDKRTCHLYDTFEGFAKNDLDSEQGRSEAKEGDYSNTSIEMVMEKLPNKEKVIVHKGVFPDTAYDTKGEFCFVNLDLDLYEPTYGGLQFFKDKMVSGGVILVHDYFAENFKGPREAVDSFIEENRGKYAAFPIGDGISVMICGF